MVKSPPFVATFVVKSQMAITGDAASFVTSLTRIAAPIVTPLCSDDHVISLMTTSTRSLVALYCVATVAVLRPAPLKPPL